MSKSPQKPTEAHTLVIKAARIGDATALRKLIESDPSLLNARDTDESTPLHCGSWKGNVEAVKVLLELGADVNAQNKNNYWGNTPLHAAAHDNQRAVAELLIANGADIHAEFGLVRTPLRETEAHNAKPVDALLIKLGATK